MDKFIDRAANVRRISLLTIILAILVIASPLLGDTGPHATVRIRVFYDGQPLSGNIYARMLERSDNSESRDVFQDTSGIRHVDSSLAVIVYDSTHACFWKPARLVSGGMGENGKLYFDYYPPSIFKIAIFVPRLQKVLLSDEIERRHFHSEYQLDISSDGSARITDVTPFFNAHDIITFLLALLITVILELLVAAIFCSIKKIPKQRVLQLVLFANLISLPIVWFVFPILVDTLVVILFAEVFAVVVEAYFVHALAKTAISLAQSFPLSVIMNLVSFVCGGIIFFIVASLSVGL